MIRSIVLAAPTVCRVDRTSCPVSARRNDGPDGLEIPHFTEEDDIRGLTQRGTQSRLIPLGIVGDFPLADDAAVMGMEEFDRILQRDDMPLARVIDPVDHTGEGGGFAAARPPR